MKLFYCTNPQHASLSHGFLGLIHVGHLVTTSQNEHTVVANINKVLEKAIDQGFFPLFKETVVLLQELIHDLRKEVQGVRLVLPVGIRAARHQNDLLERLWLDQQLEEALILTELAQNLSSIECHVHIITILGR